MKQKTKINSEMKREYAISSETIVILPEFDENGFLNSKVCKRDGISKAGLSPFNLIDTNLRFRGSSMRGALDGAQAILDKKNMNPLILDRERDMILFPCRSPFREDCVWLSLRHVKSYKRSGASHTQVELRSSWMSMYTLSVRKSNGHTSCAIRRIHRCWSLKRRCWRRVFGII